MIEEADELETKMRINSIQFNNDKVHFNLTYIVSSMCVNQLWISNLRNKNL